MDTTPHFALRYPENTDPPAGHTQIKNLAEDVENAMVIRSAKVTAIAAEQSTTSTTYTTLGTPDRVQDIELPSGGELEVKYRALVKIASFAGSVALFFEESGGGAEQLTVAVNGDSPQAQQASVTGLDYNWVYTTSTGMAYPTPDTASTAPSTEPFLIASFIPVELPAGNWEVTARFKTPGPAAISAKNRKLTVRAFAYS